MCCSHLPPAAAWHRLLLPLHRRPSSCPPPMTPSPQVTYRVLEKLGRKDSLLDIAMELEKIALQDEYFVKR